MAIKVGSVVASLTLNTGEFNTKLKAAETSLDRFSGKLDTYGGKMDKVGKVLTKRVSLPLAAIGVAAGKSAIDFETAFTGVRKTVDTSEAGFKKLETGIRDMAKEIPPSAVAISGVAEAAGQLGIETDSILGFTRVMIDLGESTNMASDEAATSLARLANITGMSQSDFDRLGSTIVDLGNNLATTESEIVAMGLRLAGAGSQIGLSEAQIMSYAGALSSVGIEAEAGGSAFSKVMVDMQLAVETGSEGLKDFAKVAGMTTDEFSNAFKEDAGSAIIAFIEGLGKSEEKGLSAIKVLDDMGISEIRLRDALLRASGASDVFKDSIEIGTKAWEENIALTTEAEQRYKTTASQVETAKDHLRDAAITAGEIVVPMFVTMAEKVKDVSNWFSNLNPETQETIVKMAGLAIAMGPVLSVGGKLLGGIGSITGAVSTMAGKMAMAKVATSSVTTPTWALGGAFKAGTALLNPWTIGLGVAAVAAVKIAKNLKEDAIPEVERFGDEISESTQESVGAFLDLEDKATQALNQLSWSGEKVSKETKDNLVNNFTEMKNQVVGKYEEQKNESIESLNKLFEKTSSLSEEEKEDAIKRTTKKYDKQIATTEAGNAKITHILEKAASENRKISEEEKIMIDKIKEDMKNNAIKVMSESETEQLAIMERLKSQSGEISARQAADIVKNSKEQKEKRIAEAEEEYNEVLKHAATLRADGTEESAKLADKIVEDAERKRKDSIFEAKKMHQGVIDEAKEQSKEHLDEIDWSTGEIKTKWEVMRDNTIETYKETRKKAMENWDDWKEDAYEEITAIGDRIGEGWDKMVTDAKEWGKNLIQGFQDGMEEKKEWIVEKSKNIGNAISTGFKKVLRIHSPSEEFRSHGRYTIEGLDKGFKENQHKPISTMQNLAKTIDNSFKEVQESVKLTTSIIENKFELWKLKNEELKGSSIVLEKQLEMQRQKHKELTKELDVAEATLQKVIEKYGEGSIESKKYTDIVLQLQIEHQKLTNEIDRTTDVINRQTRSLENQIEVIKKKNSLTVRSGNRYVVRSSGGGGGSSSSDDDDWYNWTDSDGKHHSGSKEDFDKDTGYDVDRDEVERISKEHGVDMGVAEDMAAANNRNDKKIYHDGGWVGRPLFNLEEILSKTQKFLKADERAAVLQDGEYVLSRNTLDKIKQMSYGADLSFSRNNSKSNEPKSSNNNRSGDRKITQNIVINSPTPLRPSEVARKYKQASRELAEGWGV